MKKNLLMLFAMLVSSVGAFAADKITVATVNVPSGGGEAEVVVEYDFTSSVAGFSMNFVLPKGITAVTDDKNRMEAELGFSTGHTMWISDNALAIEVSHATRDAIPSKGKLLTFKVNVDASLADDYYDASITGITLQKTDRSSASLANVSYKFKVGDTAYPIDGLNKATVTVASNLNYVYDGTEKKPATEYLTVMLEGKNLKPGRDYQIKEYQKNKDAGTATVVIEGIGDYKGTASGTFTIAKAESSVTKTPTAITGLEYNSKAQVLITDDGTVNGGTVAYSINGSTWIYQGANEKAADYKKRFEAAIVGTNAGEYTVYTKCVGDKNHNDSEVSEITVTIAKADAAYTKKPSSTTLTWTGAAQSLLTAGTTKDGTIKYQLYRFTDYTDYTYTYNYSYATSVPTGTDNGSYYVRYYIEGDANHNDSGISGVYAYIRKYEGTITSGNATWNYLVTSIANKTAEITGVTASGAEVTVPTKAGSYNVTSIADKIFAEQTSVTDITFEGDAKISLGTDALKIDGSVATIHTPQALLADYALDAQLKENFEAGKVQTTLTPANDYFSFAAAVDVVVPEGVTVNTAKVDGEQVLISEVSEAQLDLNGERVLKAGNGVVLKGAAGSEYDIVAKAGRQVSGNAVSKSAVKSYGETDLIPVFTATPYAVGAIYVLKDGAFHAILDDGTSVPGGKAVLSAPATASARVLAIGNATGISELKAESADATWYDLKGNRISAPATKGLYIRNGKKVIVK